MYAQLREGRGIMTEAIVHAVEGLGEPRIRNHVDKALSAVTCGVTNLHQDTWLRLQHATFTLDFFDDHIDPAGRDAIIEWINAHLATYTDDENPFHNSTLSKILCYLRIAYATRGDNPRWKDFRDYALVKLYEDRTVPVLNTFGAGGGFTECGWYCRHSVLNLVEAMELARRVEGYDGFARAPRFYYQRMAYELHQPYPKRLPGGGHRYSCEGDGSMLYGSFMEYPRILRRMLAQHFRGSELARLTAAAGDWTPGTPQGRWLDFLYLEPPDEPADPADAPPAHLAAGIGKVYARSDWSEDATWLRFECGDYWNQHQHFEAGSFEIFRHEPLAAESGEYVNWDSTHSVNWLVRTIAHNCILIHDPRERWKYSRSRLRTDVALANDGGQANNAYIVYALEDWLAKRDEFTRGRIVAYDNRPEFLYVAGDATAAYDPGKAALVLRRIVFLRPHAFVILDRVISTQAEFGKTWLLHCRNEPEIDERAFVVTDGPGRLDARTLLPESAEVAAVEGYTYGGREYPPANDRLASTAVRWRVEVRPSAATTDDTFLHVLSTDGPIAAHLIRDGDRVGAGTDEWRVLFDSAGGGTVTIGDAEHPLEQAVNRGEFE